MYSLLRCPVTGSKLNLQVISTVSERYGSEIEQVIHEGILFAEKDWFFPIIDGIPRMLVESFLDYQDFLEKHLSDFVIRKNQLMAKYGDFVRAVVKKNRRTKESFALEWSVYDYGNDKTWNARGPEIFQRFLKETDETAESLHDKAVFDMGCGNGYLSHLIAHNSRFVVAMDFSTSVERAKKAGRSCNILFVQGDIEFSPIQESHFDIVQCSGVLICTTDSELSFNRIATNVKIGGKLSVWLYHPRKNVIHNFFNWLRKYLSRLPLKLEYYVLMTTIFPASYVFKKLTGNKQNVREMIVDILDWFTPEFRWEHSPEEASSWFGRLNYTSVKVTTTDTFGFNMTGTRMDYK